MVWASASRLPVPRLAPVANGPEQAGRLRSQGLAANRFCACANESRVRPKSGGGRLGLNAALRVAGLNGPIDSFLKAVYNNSVC